MTKLDKMAVISVWFLISTSRVRLDKMADTMKNKKEVLFQRWRQSTARALPMQDLTTLFLTESLTQNGRLRLKCCLKKNRRFKRKQFIFESRRNKRMTTVLIIIPGGFYFICRLIFLSVTHPFFFVMKRVIIGENFKVFQPFHKLWCQQYIGALKLSEWRT